MHLLIYVILFVLLLVYIDNNKIEKLDNTQEIKRFSDNSILTNNNNDVIGQDLNQDNIYNNKFWNINSSLSNIFNKEEESKDNKEESKDNKEEKKIINKESKDNKEESKDNKQEEKIINKEEKIILENINVNDHHYKILGRATNVYYNQNYYIYENKLKEDPRMGPNNLYQYLLTNNVNEIMYKFSPRTKLNVNDTTYLSQGVLQVGPFRISAFN